MLREMTGKKDNMAGFHLHEIKRTGKLIETENRIAITRAGRRGNMEFCLKGHRVSTWDDEKFWKWIVVAIAQHGECI